MIERYTTTPSGCLQKILNDCHRGQTTVTAYLIQLRTLLGTQYDSNSPLQKDLIKHKLLESLDSHIRLYLYHYEDGPLDALAKHADKLLSLHNNFLSSKSIRSDHNDNQTLINESVNFRLQNLQRQLADISKVHTQPQTLLKKIHITLFRATITSDLATEPANAKVHHALRLATLKLLCQKTRHLPPWLKGLEAGQHRQNPLVLCDGPNHYHTISCGYWDSMFGYTSNYSWLWYLFPLQCSG